MAQILIPEIRTLISQKNFLDQQPYWIVSIDNIIVPCMSILSGILQTKFGPAKVNFILVMGQ